MNYDKHNQSELDYEQLNALLANSEFANWYFEKMNDNSNEHVSITDFVDILTSYSNNQLK